MQVVCLDIATARAFEAIVDLPSNLESHEAAFQVTKAHVSSWEDLPQTTQPSFQMEELGWAEEVCRQNPTIVAAAREVGVEPQNLYVDGQSGLDIKRENVVQIAH